MAILLHHYPASSFAEKVRLIMGYLRLEWQSVTVSPMMPRPRLDLLTGGYRRTPVLQMGADIYCDTAIIARVLSEEADDTTLYQFGFVAERVAQWADSELVACCRALNMRPEAIVDTVERVAPGQATAFKKDRRALFKGASPIQDSPEAALGAVTTYLAQLDAWMVKDFMFGAAPSIADFSVFHCLWSLAQSPLNAPLLMPYRCVLEWMERMAALGHGLREETDEEDAVDQAYDAEPRVMMFDSMELPGVGIDDYVSVAPIDYGREPVQGRLVAWSLEEIVLARDTEETNALQVHFPNAGYAIEAVGTA